MARPLVREGVRLRMNFERGRGLRYVDRAQSKRRLSAHGGLYAVICWEDGFICIGEGHSSRGRFNERSLWAIRMHSHDPNSWRDPERGRKQLRRRQKKDPLPMVVAAYDRGPEALEFFEISTDDSCQCRSMDSDDRACGTRSSWR
jgi:hypothetical protein